MSTLKKNIAYKGLLTFSNYIIGFITFPYITRVLGPENFGLVNFALNTVDYFLLFATMGIATIGTREIAAAKTDNSRLNETFSKVLGLNILFTFLALIIYIGAIFIIPKLYETRELLFIGTAKIIFTAFAIEWFFTGIEDFRYIAYRSLAIKIIYVGVIFLLIKKHSDYNLYFYLTIGSIVVNSLINFIYAHKYVVLTICFRNIKNYIKQNLRLGVYTIMTSMYITFNVMYLGMVADDFQVGYYSTAVKLYFVGVSLFGAFTAVMMPRISSLITQKNHIIVNSYLQKSFSLVFMTSLPIIILSEFYAPTLIKLLSGDGYELSIIPMRILMPALLCVWIAQIIAFQALIPLHKDKILFNASILGGCLAVIINILFTTYLASNGSAITLLICECVVTLFYIISVKHNNLVKLPSSKQVLIHILESIPYVIISWATTLINSDYLGFFVAITISIIYFIVIKPKRHLYG